MNKFLQYIQEFHENNQKEIDFVNNQLSKHLNDNDIQDTEIEHILDYLYSNPKLDISIIGYKTIKEKADKRNTKLQTIKVKDDTDWIDIVLDFNDWFKFVKLRSKESYEKEWKLMSHCVASYYGRNIDIYSLRDWNNNPHCTIEDWNQIKWKWNGNIDPKYIDYVVKFLEFKWMQVREWEMKNLWYYKLDEIEQWLSCDNTYKWYIFEWNLGHIKDSDWEKYNWFWLLKLKKLVELKLDFSLQWNFDIQSMIQYVINAVSKKTAVANASSSTAVANRHSSTAVANGINSLAVCRWVNSMAKGKIWSWLVISEWDKNNENIIRVKTWKVDGVKIKEDVLYTVKSNKFVEWKKEE